MTFVLAQVSDTHLGAGTQLFRANFDRVVAALQGLRADVLVHTGDASLDGADREADLAFAAAGRWCTWRLEVEIAPNLRLLCDDRLATDGIWASGRQHPVQHRHADGGLGLLGCEAAGPQARSDQRLVATHCRFY